MLLTSWQVSISSSETNYMWVFVLQNFMVSFYNKERYVRYISTIYVYIYIVRNIITISSLKKWKKFVLYILDRCVQSKSILILINYRDNGKDVYDFLKQDFPFIIKNRLLSILCVLFIKALEEEWKQLKALSVVFLFITDSLEQKLKNNFL